MLIAQQQKTTMEALKDSLLKLRLTFDQKEVFMWLHSLQISRKGHEVSMKVIFLKLAQEGSFKRGWLVLRSSLPLFFIISESLGGIERYIAKYTNRNVRKQETQTLTTTGKLHLPR